MPALPITPPPAARAATAPKGASPPTRPDGDFAAVLDETSARTAVAEGPKSQPTQPEPRRRGEGEASKDEAGSDGGQSPSPAVVVAPVVAQAVPNGEQSPAALTATQTVSEGGQSPSPVTPEGGLSPDVPVGEVLAGSERGLSPRAPAETDAAPADGSAGKLQLPAELLGPKAEATPDQGKDFKNSGERPKRDLPPAPTLPPTDAAAAAPAPAPAAAQAAAASPAPIADPVAPAPVAAPTPAPAPAPAPAPQAQPAATVQTAVPVVTGAPQLTRPSVLQTAERVHELVRIATTRAGNARATLQLRPAELGQVDVHLRTTRDGLVATISAHDQVGLDALQQAGNELRRSLEDKGVQLHSLDLQLGAGHHGFSNRGDAHEAASGRRGAAPTYDLDSDDPAVEDTLTITHAPSTLAGALVDVRA